MKTRKSPSSASISKSRSSRGSSNSKDSASSMVLQLIGGAMSDSLSESVSNLKDKVSEQVTIHGQEYLESARERITEATTKVVEWGKKHPVKTAAAAAALIAVSAFLYATLNGKVGEVARQAKAKLKAASGNG